MTKKSVVDWIAYILVIIGALNWGLVGLGGSSWDIISLLFGSISTLATIIYILIGLSGLWMIYFLLQKT